jgi:hypothetical protein
MFQVSDNSTHEIFIVYGIRENFNKFGDLFFLIFYGEIWQWINAEEVKPIIDLTDL